VSAALAEIEDRRRRYRGNGGMISPSGRVAIVVDQAIGPGHAMAGALRLLRSAGASKIVIAAPVASLPGVQRFERIADKTVCLRQEAELASLDHYYGDAGQVSHEEALAWLAQSTDPDE
jgi:putative phosphoribosyl transferase